MPLRLKYLTLSLCLLLFAFGCSAPGTIHSVSRDLFSDENWKIRALLQWNEEKVVGKIEASYLGVAPLEYVIVEPEYDTGNWPEGYTPPSSGKYTWNAEKTEGVIPDVAETTFMSTSILSQKPSRIMNSTEAADILQKVKVKIQLKTAQGETKIIIPAD